MALAGPDFEYDGLEETRVTAVRDDLSEQLIRELIERLETIDGIRQGLEEARTGKGRPAEEVLEEIRRKYQIPEDA